MKAPLLAFCAVLVLGASVARADLVVPPVVDAGVAASADAGGVPTPPVDASPSPTTTTTATSAVAIQPAAPPPRLLSELKQGIVQSTSGRAMGLVGMASMLLIAWLLSTDRRNISWRPVIMGVALQLVFALFVLKTGAGAWFFGKANDAITTLLSYSQAGSRFVFGNLADNKIPVGVGLSPSVDDPRVVGELFAATGSMIAFRVLPTILFFSALTAVLYHLGILQRVVKGIALIMQKTMGTSGAESLSASANIFVGQTEAPLLVRPYLEKMTISELCCVMTGGFATVAGGVMAAYVGMLSSTFPDIAGHLLAASVMSAPAALVMAKIMVPETGVPETRGGAHVPVDKLDANLIDAATRGTSEGLHLALNVAAMLIGFLALLALLNGLVGGVGGLVGLPGMNLETIFGYVGAPLAFLLGTPAEDAVAVGQLLGTKTVVNEFVAYLQLNSMMQDGTLVHGKSVVIAVYALCGFSNFGSIGIQIGGLAALAPSRRGDLARVGLRAMIAGSLACFQTAAIAAMVL
jgi:CNT family concentrative nucleoside transporter